MTNKLILTKRGETVLGVVAILGFVATSVVAAIALWAFTILIWAAFA